MGEFLFDGPPVGVDLYQNGKELMMTLNQNGTVLKKVDDGKYYPNWDRPMFVNENNRVKFGKDNGRIKYELSKSEVKTYKSLRKP